MKYLVFVWAYNVILQSRVYNSDGFGTRYLSFGCLGNCQKMKKNMKSLLAQQLLQLAFLNTFSADSEYQSEYPIRFLIWYPIRHYYRKIRNSKKLLFGGPAHNFRVSYLRSTFMNHMHLHTMELLGWIIFFVLKTVIVHGTEFPPWTSFNIQLSCVDSQFLHVIKRYLIS